MSNAGKTDELKGRIFNLQRYSTGDGPGICQYQSTKGTGSIHFKRAHQSEYSMAVVLHGAQYRETSWSGVWICDELRGKLT